ncbi:hypothetical protein [Streptomyces sp. NPDC057545]|uniref:hypothetical protein n=1 Tax=Streptomyces sp. NPDC057545 TaxID=3346164 RepID=UPI00368A1ED1
MGPGPWAFGQFPDHYPAGLRPFNGRAASAVAGLRRSRNGENSTPVVPSEILQPMLGAALYMVQVLSPHILALRNQVRDRRQAAPSPERQVRGVAVLEEAVRRRITDDRWSRGRVALLGDTGYCATPLTGLGTSLALAKPPCRRPAPTRRRRQSQRCMIRRYAGTRRDGQTTVVGIPLL